jgi:hypothetical protein
MELLYPIQNGLSDVENAPIMPFNYTKLAIRGGILVNFIDTVYSEDYFKMLTGAFAQFQKDKNA